MKWQKLILGNLLDMSFLEITGQPCSGKSSFIAKQASDKEAYFFKQGPISKIFSFFSGINFLGPKRVKVLFDWSLIEDAPLYFRINIFRNAVTKFGIFSSLQASTNDYGARLLVDEGISHLPFLFLKTDTSVIVNFITTELQITNVHYLSSPGYDVINNRLLSRGHKRLTFLRLSSFVTRIREIESVLLSQYPNLCKKFRTFEDVTSI